VDAQARQLTKAGCKKVFRDVHVSGAKTDHAQLRRVIETLEPGDVLMVTRLDRLARSTRDLLNTLATITEREAAPPSGCGGGDIRLTANDGACKERTSGFNAPSIMAPLVDVFWPLRRSSMIRIRLVTRSS
jgi:hypothetical protein